ncbi:MAG: hypothetical protein WC365_01250 [Candidatus Babeliales bacterium]|jgi:hypothetical protein
MNLTPKQRAILVSLYRRYVETGRRDTFVATKGISSSTMKSFYKTGYIETDRAIQNVPSNMRISDAGVEVMKEYFDKRKKSVDAIITRNKRFMRFVQNTEEKRLILLDFLQGSPLLAPNITVTHIGYGIFEVNTPGLTEQYFGVYNLTEGNAVEIGGCRVVDKGSQKYYIEKVKLL